MAIAGDGPVSAVTARVVVSAADAIAKIPDAPVTSNPAVTSAAPVAAAAASAPAASAAPASAAPASARAASAAPASAAPGRRLARFACFSVHDELPVFASFWPV